MQGLSEVKNWLEFKLVMKSRGLRIVQIYGGWICHFSLVNTCNLQIQGPKTIVYFELFLLMLMFGYARRRNEVLSSVLSPDGIAIDQYCNKIIHLFWSIKASRVSLLELLTSNKGKINVNICSYLQI